MLCEVIADNIRSLLLIKLSKKNFHLYHANILYARRVQVAVLEFSAPNSTATCTPTQEANSNFCPQPVTFAPILLPLPSISPSSSFSFLPFLAHVC